MSDSTPSNAWTWKLQTPDSSQPVESAIIPYEKSTESVGANDSRLLVDPGDIKDGGKYRCKCQKISLPRTFAMITLPLQRHRQSPILLPVGRRQRDLDDGQRLACQRQNAHHGRPRRLRSRVRPRPRHRNPLLHRVQRTRLGWRPLQRRPVLSRPIHRHHGRVGQGRSPPA